jgi:ABC-2 type transport system permease protein
MTTIHLDAAPHPGPARPSTFVRRVSDVSSLTWRNIVHIAREPLQLSDVTIQPVLFTLLFVYIFGAGVTLGRSAHYVDFAIAGMLALNLTTSAMGTSVGLSNDLNGGIIDRFRTLPMWRPAVLVGRSLTDLLGAALCAFFVAATGLLMGWRPQAGLLSTLGGFGVFLLFSYALSWACACLGIVSKGPESAQGIGLIILFPLAIVSNALVPTAHMPAPLRIFANWNPVSAVTAAARTLFRNPNPSAQSTRGPCNIPWPRLCCGLSRLSSYSPRWLRSSIAAAPRSNGIETSLTRRVMLLAGCGLDERSTPTSKLIPTLGGPAHLTMSSRVRLLARCDNGVVNDVVGWIHTVGLHVRRRAPFIGGNGG